MNPDNLVSVCINQGNPAAMQKYFNHSRIAAFETPGIFGVSVRPGIRIDFTSIDVESAF